MKLNLKSKNRPVRSGRRSEGQSLVEFALGVPLILLLLLGTIDLGQIFFEYIQLRNAVREGASFGSRDPFNEAGIRAVVREHAGDTNTGSQISGITDANISITRDNCCTVGVNGSITVGSSVTFSPITTGFLERFGLGSVTLQASSKARVMT